MITLHEATHVQHSMSANSEIVFRILGIPSDATIANLGEVLAAQFSAEGIALNTRKITICPSCYSDGTQTALVQFVPNPPVALLALTNGGGYDIEFGDSGQAIYVDRDLYGLTPLYGTAEPIEAEWVVFYPSRGALGLICQWHRCRMRPQRSCVRIVERKK